MVPEFFLTTAAALNLQNRWQWVVDLILLVEDWKPFLSLSSLIAICYIENLDLKFQWLYQKEKWWLSLWV